MSAPENGAVRDAGSPLRICIYAFSSTALFFRALIDECARAGDSIDWSVIQPQGHFRYVLDGVVPDDRRCYLYDRFGERYAANSSADLERALASGDGIVSGLFKDKDGYRWLDKDEQMRRAAAMDAVYRAFLRRMNPDFVLFPDLETVDGFILMNVCRDLGIGVLYYTGLRFLGRAYFAPDAVETLPAYFGDYTDGDRIAARKVIDHYLAGIGNEPGHRYPRTIPPKPSWFRRIIVSSWLRHTRERLHASEETFAMRITRHILGVMTRVRRRRFDLVAARYFDARDAAAPLPPKFVLYALQYTPESSINGLEPYYVDQTRVIDALLLSLPPGYRLLVKEHPAMMGMRPIAFYRELRRKPGLVLAHPRIDTRKLMMSASIVATVTGTIGLEAWLLGKPAVLFGRSFFSHLCYRAPAPGELRPFLERVIADHVAPTEADKERELARLLAVGDDFVISDPWFVPTVMAPDNVRATRAYLWRHLARLGVAAATASRGA